MATYGQYYQFGPYDSAGTLITSLKVYHYEAGSLSTLKNAWSDRAKTSTVAQPLLSDANGVAGAFFDGLYQIVIKDGSDNTLYTLDNFNFSDASGALSGEGAALTSASTLTLGTDGNFFHITGSTGITTLSGTQPIVYLAFDSTPTLTYSGSLILLGGVSYTAVANDVLTFINDGSGVWREIARNYAFKSSYGYTTDQPGLLENIGFTAAVAASALTFTLTAKDGTSLSTTNYGRIAFRNATLTTGQYTAISVTSALTVTISSGSTLGTINATIARIYLGAIDNGGTVELCAWNPLTTTGLVGFSESAVQTTTAEGGAGAADSAGVVYSTTARSSKAFRILGYIEIQEATAGTWSTSPTVLQIMGPGVRRTGDTVQIRRTQTGETSGGTTVVPYDDTPPTSSEGTQFLSQAIVPTSTVNRLLLASLLNLSSTSADNRLVMWFIQDAAGNALAASTTIEAASDVFSQASLFHEMAAGTTSSTTITARAGQAGAATIAVNGISAARKYGGNLSSFLEITEVFT